MSFQALPIQFLNLGGEMLYIIDQRLRAQNIDQDKSAQVRNDIIGIMLNRRFVQELFKLQPLYSHMALRSVFGNLAHASIMRLNTVSMDKLFELMVMALKHQLMMSPGSKDLLYVTFNHLDSLIKFATSVSVEKQVKEAIEIYAHTYLNMSDGELLDIRLSLLNFVQDMNTRVSIFLKEKIQNHFGKFVIHNRGPVPAGIEVPGVIRTFGTQGLVQRVERFPAGGEFSKARTPGSLRLFEGDRCTNLGKNIYATKFDGDEGEMLAEEDDESAEERDEEGMSTFRDIRDEGGSAEGKRELSLLSQLIGSVSAPSKELEFRLSLFDSQELKNEEFLTGNSNSSEITIERRIMEDRPELGKIMKEFSPENDEGSANDENYLLDLLDSL